uniref:Atg6 BARA domain-containing protein n=1 Tax=Bicosoecida sp. CB-2014 TaxID=1486930 RepID=A0A7S1G4N8_9STRA
MAALERRCWAELARANWAIDTETERRRSYVARRRHCESALARLHALSVLNDAFFVWHDGPFGTINGFRLGKLPWADVSWSEINAAFGQAAMLLNTVADSVGYVFRAYTPVPMGSYSRLAKVGDERTTHQLFIDSQGGYVPAAAKMWLLRGRLNDGIRRFVGCVVELAAFAASRDRAFCLPYNLQADRERCCCCGLDLTVDSNPGVGWTRAIKLLLTDLKFLVAWALAYTQGNGGSAGAAPPSPLPPPAT